MKTTHGRSRWKLLMGGADGNYSWEESVDNQRVSSAPGRPGLAWHGPLPDKYFGEFRFRKF